VLPDNGWFLQLYPNLEYKYIHFSGFGGGNGNIEKGQFKLENKKIAFITEQGKSYFDSESYYLFELKESGYEKENCMVDTEEKYCLIINDE
jgi:hypothetical protein